MKTLKERWEESNDGATVTYSPVELGLEDLGFVDLVELGLDDGGALAWITAECTEGLDFHRAHSPEYFTPDGLLTVGARCALQAIFQERYHATLWEVEDDCFRFSVELCTSGDSPESDVVEVIWPTLARISNETDPGTFGSEYLFGTIMADALKERA